MHRFGYSPRRIAILALTSLAAMAGVQSNASPAQASGTVQGCPVGYLCLYKSKSWNGGNQRPDAKYYRCGVVNLSGWVTRHGSVLNNQTSGVTTQFYRGFNGTGTVLAHLFAYDYRADFDFYPVNSIRVC